VTAERPTEGEGGLYEAAVALGLAGLACALFTLPSTTQFRLVRVQDGGLAVLVVLALLAVVGGRLRRRAPVATAGAAFLVAALVQLAQLGRDTNWLQGDGSTFSLFLGLGVGLLTLGLVPKGTP